jgi:uncharacterized membrane protein
VIHPFDLKQALLAKHAQHVVLIHFPIALFLSGTVFDLAARWRRSSSLALVAYYNILTAAAAAIPTVLTGLLAWRWQLEGQRLRGVLLLHLVFACLTTVLLAASALQHWHSRSNASSLLVRFRIGLEMVAAAMIVLTAHLGGFLSGVNGTF